MRLSPGRLLSASLVVINRIPKSLMFSQNSQSAARRDPFSLGFVYASSSKGLCEFSVVPARERRPKSIFCFFSSTRHARYFGRNGRCPALSGTPLKHFRVGAEVLRNKKYDIATSTQRARWRAELGRGVVSDKQARRIEEPRALRCAGGACPLFFCCGCFSAAGFPLLLHFRRDGCQTSLNSGAKGQTTAGLQKR